MMTAPPKISIVVPSFNQGEFLGECLRSIIDQQYPALELIVIDGGSTDASVSIIESVSEQLDYWVSEPDGGQSAAINKGFGKASGQLVAWLNSDDYYLPGTLEAVARAYEANPEAPFYFGDGLRVDRSGSVLGRFFPKGLVPFDRTAFVMGLNYILQPSTFMQGRAMSQIGYLDTDLHYGMDSDLWIRLSALGQPQMVDGVLAASREYETTKTASGAFKRIEELRDIAARHSGSDMTPGVLCYFLDTLYRHCKDNPETYPESYLAAISRFWGETSGLFEQFNAGRDGFPLPPVKQGVFDRIFSATKKERA